MGDDRATLNAAVQRIIDAVNDRDPVAGAKAWTDYRATLDAMLAAQPVPAPAPSEPSLLDRWRKASREATAAYRRWDDACNSPGKVGAIEARFNLQEAMTRLRALELEMLSAAPVASPASEPSEAATAAALNASSVRPSTSYSEEFERVERMLRAAYAVDYRGAAPPSPETRDAVRDWWDREGEELVYYAICDETELGSIAKHVAQHACRAIHAALSARAPTPEGQ